MQCPKCGAEQPADNAGHLLGALIMGLALLWGARLCWRQLHYLRAVQPGTSL